MSVITKLFGNPEKSGHPGELDIQKLLLFTDPTAPHRCPVVAFNRKRALIFFPFAINIAMITPPPNMQNLK